MFSPVKACGKSHRSKHLHNLHKKLCEMRNLKPKLLSVVLGSSSRHIGICQDGSLKKSVVWGWYFAANTQLL